MSIFNTRFGLGSNLAEVQRNIEAKRLEQSSIEELLKAKTAMTAAAASCDISKIAEAMASLKVAQERKVVVDAMAKAACEGSFDTGNDVKSVSELFTLTKPGMIVLHRVVTPPPVDIDTTVVKDAVKAALAEARDDVLGGISNVVNETMVDVLRDFQAHAQDLVKAAMADAIAEKKANSVQDKQEFIDALGKSIEEALKNALNIQVPTPI